MDFCSTLGGRSGDSPTCGPEPYSRRSRVRSMARTAARSLRLMQRIVSEVPAAERRLHERLFRHFGYLAIMRSGGKANDHFFTSLNVYEPAWMPVFTLRYAACCIENGGWASYFAIPAPERFPPVVERFAIRRRSILRCRPLFELVARRIDRTPAWVSKDAIIRRADVLNESPLAGAEHREVPLGLTTARGRSRRRSTSWRTQAEGCRPPRSTQGRCRKTPAVQER